MIHQGSGDNLSPLLRLNFDLLICIASNLDTRSLSKLSQTCHYLYNIIEGHGWKALWLNLTSSSSLGDVFIPCQDESNKYKRYLQIDNAWATKTFQHHQHRLPFVATPNGKADKHHPQPILLLTPMALMLFTGSEMRLWPKSILQKEGPVQIKQTQVFYLNNPAGLDSNHRPGATPLALWDICTCTQLDKLGEYVAFGRLNGLVEIIRLSTSKKHSRQKKRVLINLVWLWRSSTTSIQAIHACPESGLLAVASKSGSIALFKSFLQGSKGIKMQLIEQWSIGSRPWSVWIHQCQWLAVGVSNVEPILFYPLQEGTYKPCPAIHLRTTTAKVASVYAMKSKMVNGNCLLLAGCYDGVLREYDVSSISSSTPEKTEAFLPQTLMRDRFDSSAIYCLCVGIGQRGEDIAAGTARHGVCKVFPSTRKEIDGYSMFAAHPSQSPTYSLVGQYDRLFGVTDTLFWQIDLRPPCSSPPIIDNRDQNKLAYYHHGEMVLESSRCP